MVNEQEPGVSPSANRSGPDSPSEYRKLPAVDHLLRRREVASLAADYGDAYVVGVLRTLLADVRAQIAAGGRAPQPDDWPRLLAQALAEQSQPTLRPVLNATGVIVHTNLGRAPLSTAAQEAVTRVARGYNNLEYDLETGQRGSRHDHARGLLAALTGAEDVVVVNNNAAAVFLTLSALCQGREVVVSRGQLVEIGGGFRIPDVLRQSGARLIEVGTTNRTHVRDFTEAMGPETAAFMRIHSSNFRQMGFVAEPSLGELAAAAHAGDEPVLLIDDLGSGSLLDTRPYGLAPEPLVQESLQAGVDVVTFSGDKLLGGPQAGLIAGKRHLVERVRRHPLARALRVDKMTLAALEATLRSYQRGQATAEIPVWRMIAAGQEKLADRARNWQKALAATSIDASIWPGESAVGGGSLPGETLPTHLLALPVDTQDAVAAALRRGSPPVVCRIQQETLLFDPRTVLPEQDDALVDAIQAVWRAR